MIEKVLNANVYVAGNNLLGKAQEVRLPNISVQKTEHRPLGIFTTVALPQGIERMELSIVFQTFNADVLKKADPFNPIDIAIRAVQQEYNNFGNLQETKQVRVYCRGTFRNLDLGTITAEDGGTRTHTVDLVFYQLIVDGQLIHQIDPLNAIYIVDGKDLLADARSALGY